MTNSDEKLPSPNVPATVAESAKPVPPDPQAVANTEKILAGLLYLEPRERLIFVAHRFDNLSFSQLADRLGIKPSSVESYLVKAIQHLREHLHAQLSAQ